MNADYLYSPIMLIEEVVQRCIKILERDDVKGKIEGIVRPVVALILERLYPYIFVTMTLIIIIFGLLVCILVTLIRLLRAGQSIKSDDCLII